MATETRMINSLKAIWTYTISIQGPFRNKSQGNIPKRKKNVA